MTPANAANRDAGLPRGRLFRQLGPYDRRPGGSPSAPDWICEILSTNKRNDLIKKKRAYHQHDVGHYWLVDPVDETLAVHRWHADGYVEILIADRDERVRAEPFDAIDLRVVVLFGDDDDE